MRRSVRGALLAPLLLFVLLSVPACAGLDLLADPAGGPSPPPSGSLSVSFIDVGQGDSVLVQAGGTDHLIDAGPPEAGPEVVDFLRSRGVERLDGVINTSGDADHVGGMPDVFEAFPVERVYVSGFPKETLAYNTFLRAVREEGLRLTAVRAGHRMDWGGVRVDVVNPPPELFSESNDNSVAVLLTYGAARILLSGDAEEKAEEYMARGPYTGPVTVLKVNHHGSNTSTTPIFLSRFPPEIAVIQVGEENSYGHPTPEVLARLKRAGARVFRNDLHGDVIVTVKDRQVEVAVTEP